MLTSGIPELNNVLLFCYSQEFIVYYSGCGAVRCSRPLVWLPLLGDASQEVRKQPERNRPRTAFLAQEYAADSLFAAMSLISYVQ